MKKILIIVFGIALLMQGSVTAQNNESKADDANRIAITPQVNDQTIPQGAKNLLQNKMTQICAKNGLSGDAENPFFIMDASISVLSKELTATAPPMHALNMLVSFYIKDANGAVFSETSYEAKGVGQNETKAYIGGIKSINPSAGQFKAFVDRGKTKIIEYYNSQCDFVISSAKALQKQGRNDRAIIVLQSVPPVCKECYDMCMEVLADIAPSEDFVKAETAAITGVTATKDAGAATGAGVKTGTDSVSTAGVSPNSATVAPAAATVIGINSKVFFEKDGETRFPYKEFAPGKVKTMPSATTKNEYEIMAISDCSSDQKWSADVITQWHNATKDNIKEGMVVLYTFSERDITPTVCFHIGKVIAVDELYKDIVTIKGYYNDIKKINYNQVLIVDKSNIEQ